MKVIGLTGGIASGKSTASSMLKQFKIDIIDADLIARDIVKPGEPALREIINNFGKEIVDEFGTLRRSVLSQIVFNDKDKLNKLNQITHKRIIERIKHRIKEYRDSEKNKILVLDAALLIELDLCHLVDEIWLIVVDKETQVARLINRENMSREDALKIIDAQMQLEEKKRYADVLIDNTESIDFMKKQLLLHIDRILEER